MSIVKPSDVKEEAQRSLAERIGFCKVIDGQLHLKIRFPEDEPIYPIDLSQCKNPTDILGWAVHLSDKSWMTPRRMRIFIEKAAAENRINLTGV